MSNRIRLCARCRNHNERNPVKDHKEQCRYKNCKCERCILIIQRQQVQSALKKLQHTDGPSRDGNNNSSKCQLSCQSESRLSSKGSSTTSTNTTLPSERPAVSTTGCFGIPGTMSPLCPPLPFRPLPLLPESLFDPRFLLSLGGLPFPSSMMQFVENSESSRSQTLSTQLMFPSTSSTDARTHNERNDRDEDDREDRSHNDTSVDEGQP